MPQRSARASQKVSRRRKASGSSWRGLVRLSSLKKKIRLFFLALIAVGLSTAILTSLSLYKFLRAPFTQASGGSLYEQNWDGQRPINLLLVKLADRDQPSSAVEYLGLLHLDPASKKYGLVEVPVETVVEMPFSLRQAPLAQSYAAGNLLQPPQGVHFVAKAVEKAVAVPVEAYLLTDKSGWDELTNNFGLVAAEDLGAAVGWDKIWRLRDVVTMAHRVTRTSLGLTEIWRVLFFLNQAKAQEGGIWRWDGGSLEACMNQDERWRKVFAESRVLSEGRRVLVLNGTEKAGLGAFWARMVNNLGGAVLDVSNSSRPYAESAIVALDPKSYTVELLARSLGISQVETYLESRHGSEPGVAQADITIIFGLDKLL
ncbi:MAG: LytR C-terminal domain-containing protein [bacterium]|nr:LytR C-terminal domain-containing protein [bacterium]